MRLRAFLAFAAEFESSMPSAVGRFGASFPVEGNWDYVSFRRSAPAPLSDALLDVEVSALADRHVGGFGSRCFSSLPHAESRLSLLNRLRLSALAWEFLAVSILALLSRAQNFCAVDLHTEDFILVFVVLLVGEFSAHAHGLVDLIRGKVGSDSPRDGAGLAEQAVHPASILGGLWSRRQFCGFNEEASRNVEASFAIVPCRRHCSSRNQDENIVDGVHFSLFSWSPVPPATENQK